MKYAFLLLALMFVGCGGGSSTVGYEIKIDGRTIQVAKEDFPSDMSWDDAMAACQNLGNGWRLPRINELKAINKELHIQQRTGNFIHKEYWSSYEIFENTVYYFNFDTGKFSYSNKSNTKSVRAVRTLP